MAIKKTVKKKKTTTTKIRTSGYVEKENDEGMAEIAKLLNRSKNYVVNEAYKAYINANLHELRKSLK